MVGDAGIVAIRLWELAMVGTWVAGVWLVRRYGATPFLVGLYAGGSVTAFWDWLLSDRWFFNMNTDTRFVHLFTLDGIMEPLWAGFSYGFFFGICAVVVVRHRAWLDQHLGAWQYLAVPLLLGASDFVIEGISVGWLNLYRFEYRGGFLLFGVPYTNLIFIGVTQAVLIFIARRAADLCERAGYPVERPERRRCRRASRGTGGGGRRRRSDEDAGARGDPPVDPVLGRRRHPFGRALRRHGGERVRPEGAQPVLNDRSVVA
jgi:hypothetical protein